MMGVPDDKIPIHTNKERGRLDIKIPKIFSLIENPEGVFSVLEQLGKTLGQRRYLQINIDHESCLEHDLGAEIILAKAVKRVKSYLKSESGITRWSGVLPDSVTMKRLICSIGVVPEVTSRPLSFDGKDRLRLFRAKGVGDSFGNPREQDAKTRNIESFVEYLDVCLRDHCRRLTKSGKTGLSAYVGEILSNAEEHSGEKHWHIYGYLDNDADNHYCEILIYNYGFTIFDSFYNSDVNSYAKSVINPYLSEHRSEE